MIVGFFVIKTG